MDERQKRNTSYVIIVSQDDGTWLAESPLYPMCKGEGKDANTAYACLINSILVKLSELAGKVH